MKRALPLRVYGLVSLMLASIVFAGATVAADPASPAHPAAAPPRPLIAAIPDNFLPIYDVTTNQVPTGFGVEFMELVAEHAQLEVRYRILPDWAAVHAALRNGEADLIPNIGITVERSRNFLFSAPVLQFTLRLFIRDEDRNRIASLDDIVRQRGRVAVVENNAGRALFNQRKDIAVETYRSLADAFVALRSGEVDALVFPAEVAHYLGRQLGIDSKIRAVGAPLAYIPRGIAVRKDRVALLQQLDRVIPQVRRTPDYDLMLRRWFPQPEPWWTWRHTLILAGALVSVAAVAAGAMRYIGLRRSHQRLRQSMALNQAILDTALEGVLTIDAGGGIHSANQSALRMLHCAATDLIGRSVADVLIAGARLPIGSESDRRDLHTILAAAAANPDDDIELLGLRGDERFPVRARVARLQQLTPQLLVLTVQDLSAQRQAEDYARYVVDHDPLTGLLNHQGALLVLDNILERAARAQIPACCVMLGLDRFAHFNEVYGQTAGDALLMAVAGYLGATVRQCDVVGHPSDSSLLARPGSDLFLLVLSDTDSIGGRTACERILHGLRDVTVEVSGRTVRCAAHAGLACYPHHGVSAAELVSHAEIALLAARDSRVHSIAEFSDGMRSLHHEESRRVQLIFEALDRNLFALHFQPVLDLRNGSVRHFEALVRIDGGNGGLIAPGEFIPTAERHGLIARIDYAVLRLAFSHLAGSGPADDFTLAVNLSAAHFGDQELLRWLERAFAENVVQPRQLVFEITETSALHNITAARDFMEPLRTLGCRFALDDFGVGFSSFEYLRLLPVDYVKIDGSFVRNLPANAEDQAIARAITEVAHATGRKVIAEFVESRIHLDMLAAMGVDYAQGFHIGRPVSDPPHAQQQYRLHSDP